MLIPMCAMLPAAARIADADHGQRRLPRFDIAAHLFCQSHEPQNALHDETPHMPYMIKAPTCPP